MAGAALEPNDELQITGCGRANHCKHAIIHGWCGTVKRRAKIIIYAQALVGLRISAKIHVHLSMLCK
jgi:hypothetical protein